MTPRKVKTLVVTLNFQNEMCCSFLFFQNFRVSNLPPPPRRFYTDASFIARLCYHALVIVLGIMDWEGPTDVLEGRTYL